MIPGFRTACLAQRRSSRPCSSMKSFRTGTIMLINVNAITVAPKAESFQERTFFFQGLRNSE